MRFDGYRSLKSSGPPSDDRNVAVRLVSGWSHSLYDTAIGKCERLGSRLDDDAWSELHKAATVCKALEVSARNFQGGDKEEMDKATIASASSLIDIYKKNIQDDLVLGLSMPSIDSGNTSFWARWGPTISVAEAISKHSQSYLRPTQKSIWNIAVKHDIWPTLDAIASAPTEASDRKYYEGQTRKLAKRYLKCTSKSDPRSSRDDCYEQEKSALAFYCAFASTRSDCSAPELGPLDCVSVGDHLAEIASLARDLLSRPE